MRSETQYIAAGVKLRPLMRSVSQEEATTSGATGLRQGVGFGLQSVTFLSASVLVRLQREESFASLLLTANITLRYIGSALAFLLPTTRRST